MRNFTYITEYLPKRYDANAQQEHDRELCYSFKDGILYDEVKDAFLEKIESITGGNTTDWVVCFIPASTEYKTRQRFSRLAQVIENAGYVVKKDAVYNKYDTEAGHIAGKEDDPTASFGFDGSKVNGKKVILIDDIITRGKTYGNVADKLENAGATCVSGLFLAKTINPDYHQSSYDDDYDEYDSYDPYYEEPTYERYNGSYAQDVEGWSDQDIDDVFDGDPDAYWNID